MNHIEGQAMKGTSSSRSHTTPFEWPSLAPNPDKFSEFSSEQPKNNFASIIEFPPSPGPEYKDLSENGTNGYDDGGPRVEALTSASDELQCRSLVHTEIEDFCTDNDNDDVYFSTTKFKN